MPETFNYEKEMREQAISKAEQFRKSQDSGETSKIICAAKKLVFEDHQGEELDASKPGKLVVMQEAVKYIVEEIMELTPAEYDAIYSTTLNQKATLDHAIRKIINNAPPKVAMEALFDNKAILFHMVWPDYYEQNYTKPTAMDIFNATGETKGNLVRAGRIKDIPVDEIEPRILNNGKFSTAKKERKRVYNHGEKVDKLVYWAMESILPMFEMKTEELFFSLAKPRSAGWSKYGFVKIIEARGCYPSPLDFYMWNSPVDYQLDHIEEYMEARKKAKLPTLPALEVMYAAYKKNEDRINNDLSFEY